LAASPSSRGPEKAFLVSSPDSAPQVVWTRRSVESGTFGGYGWVLAAFGLLVAFGTVFIAVI